MGEWSIMTINHHPSNPDFLLNEGVQQRGSFLLGKSVHVGEKQDQLVNDIGYRQNHVYVYFMFVSPSRGGRSKFYGICCFRSSISDITFSCCHPMISIKCAQIVFAIWQICDIYRILFICIHIWYTVHVHNLHTLDWHFHAIQCSIFSYVSYLYLSIIYIYIHLFIYISLYFYIYIYTHHIYKPKHVHTYFYV